MSSPGAHPPTSVSLGAPHRYRQVVSECPTARLMHGLLRPSMPTPIVELDSAPTFGTDPVFRPAALDFT